MKHLPKSTPTEILNDPYGFTYKEMSEVIGEDKARALYTELYSAICLIAAVLVRISGRPGSVLSAVSAVPGP